MSEARVNQWTMAGFTAETPVLMADGNSKPISKIQEGDVVLSFDPETRIAEPKLVINTWSEVINDILEIDLGDKKMIVSNEQRFFTPDGEFKTAPEANGILTVDGTIKRFTTRKSPGKVKLYDITVDENHAFFADGLMVHNWRWPWQRRRKKQQPPPDPVVTAGKVGRPLTVTVNGNVITVPPAPGSAAQISVSHLGGISTGYHSIPGYIGNFEGDQNLLQPRTPAAWVPKLRIADAEAVRKQVCNDMVGYTGIVGGKRGQWVSSIEEMRRLVDSAKKQSPFIYTNYGNLLPPGSIAPAVMVDIYQTTQNNIDELRRYVKRNVNFTKKDTDFIAGVCAQIEGGLKSITAQLDGYISRQPAPINRRPGWIYADSPVFGYYRYVDRINGREAYYYSPPNLVENLICYTGPDAIACRPRSAYYFRDLDPTTGLNYYYKADFAGPVFME